MDIDGSTPAAVLNATNKTCREDALARHARSQMRDLGVKLTGSSPVRARGNSLSEGAFTTHSSRGKV